jgi:LPXTG-motif cell wall-anchored protein
MEGWLILGGAALAAASFLLFRRRRRRPGPPTALDTIPGLQRAIEERRSVAVPGREARRLDRDLATLERELTRARETLRSSQELLQRIRVKLALAERDGDESGLKEWARRARETESVIAELRILLNSPGKS